MNRISMLILSAMCALFIGGCASDGDYYKAVAMMESAKAEAQVAKYKAQEAALTKATPEGAGYVAMAIALSDRGSNASTTVLAPPESWFDKSLRLVGALSNIGQIAVNFKQVTESGKTARAISADNVNVEAVRGQTLASVVAAVGKSAGTTTSTTISAGGDVANNGSTIDRKNCASGNSIGGPGASGGNGAPGGNGAIGGNGGQGSPGSSTTGNSPGGSGAPGAPGGAGASGGSGAPGGSGGPAGSTGGNCK